MWKLSSFIVLSLNIPEVLTVTIFLLTCVGSPLSMYPAPLIVPPSTFLLPEPGKKYFVYKNRNYFKVIHRFPIFISYAERDIVSYFRKE